jgi:hypothetical protein
MFKNAIAPIQAWLLSQGRCVGCGKPLKSMKEIKRGDDTSKITCECGRIYVHDPKTKKYRRALLNET